MHNKTKQILDILAVDFPNAKSQLIFSNPFELIVAVILSAQCTDERVNKITSRLFMLADTPQKMAAMDIEQLEKIIYSCGFYHSKAKYLKLMSQNVLDRFNGKVPDNLKDLMSLKGVGRKTANVVFAVAFNGQAIAVDTHVFRVSNRLGIAHAKTVLETEKQLMAAIDKDLWSKSHHYLLLHGRYVCKSVKPKCCQCSVKQYCDYYGNKLK